jgi:NTP pyrophosphatase (non-canonical NTP hydrolase)
VDFCEYQQAALKTDQPTAQGADPVVLPMLGLLGEAGSVATAYKKRMRDGAAFEDAKQQIREELGDVLWYLATLAARFDLDLEDIAVASLFKTADRWRPTPGQPILFDDQCPQSERLPRQAVFTFTPETRRDGRTVIALRCDGHPIGDPLTDASHIDDDYRLHDAFHLAYAAVLGWSPVLRSLMKRKRKSDPRIDEAEDGGRAIAIEEGISALVFSYAARHGYLASVQHVDHELLNTIGNMVGHLEVSVRRAADWEVAITTGFDVWRRLRETGGGTVLFDMPTRTLRVT